MNTMCSHQRSKRARRWNVLEDSAKYWLPKANADISKKNRDNIVSVKVSIDVSTQTNLCSDLPGLWDIFCVCFLNDKRVFYNFFLLISEVNKKKIYPRFRFYTRIYRTAKRLRTNVNWPMT